MAIVPALALDHDLGGRLYVGHNWNQGTWFTESVSWEGRLHYWGFGAQLGLRETIGRGTAFHGLQAHGMYLRSFEGLHAQHQLKIVGSYNYSPYELSKLHEHIWALYAQYGYPHIQVSLGYQIRYLHSNGGSTSHAEFNNCLYSIEAYVWDKSKVRYNLYFELHNFEPLWVEHTATPMFTVKAQYRQREPAIDYQLQLTFVPAGVGNIVFNHYGWRTAICVNWHF